MMSPARNAADCMVAWSHEAAVLMCDALPTELTATVRRRLGAGTLASSSRMLPQLGICGLPCHDTVSPVISRRLSRLRARSSRSARSARAAANTHGRHRCVSLSGVKRDGKNCSDGFTSPQVVHALLIRQPPPEICASVPNVRVGRRQLVPGRPPSAHRWKARRGCGNDRWGALFADTATRVVFGHRTAAGRGRSEARFRPVVSGNRQLA